MMSKYDYDSSDLLIATLQGEAAINKLKSLKLFQDTHNMLARLGFKSTQADAGSLRTYLKDRLA